MTKQPDPPIVIQQGPTTPTMVSQSWWLENWDKVVLGVLGLVVSAVVGYASAMIAVSKESATAKAMSESNQSRIISLEANTANVSATELEVTRLRDRIDDLERQNLISTELQTLISSKDDLVRQETIRALRELLSEIRVDP